MALTIIPSPAQEASDPRTLFDEAGKAFSEKEYKTAIEKIQLLLPFIQDPKDERRELLLFNVGLAHFLDGNPTEAEKAFNQCIVDFPKGEYTSRAFLGLGRAVVAQENKAKQEIAIKAFTRAAADPKYRTQASLSLGLLYSDQGNPAKALSILRNVMGSDVRTPEQTAASVEVVSLLAHSGKLPSLIAYLERLSQQPGINDAITWYANQVISIGDDLVSKGQFDAALAIFRSIPARDQILSTQSSRIALILKDLSTLKDHLKKIDPKDQKNLPRIQAITEQVEANEGLISQIDEATKAIEELKDLDAMLLMRKGRCFFYLDRKEEALLCFSTIRNRYPNASDAQSAAFAEIVVHNQFHHIDQIQPLGEAYLSKFPDATNAEQVATLVGELLAQSNDWPRVLGYYRNLSEKYPNSASIDRFIFLQGVAMFQNGDFNDAAGLLEDFIRKYPDSQLLESAVYRVAMAYFLTNNYKKTMEWLGEYRNRFPEGLYAGDVLYRLCFIDSQDKQTDQSEHIITTLSEFLQAHPEDAAAGSMYCLLADTLNARKATDDASRQLNEDQALDAYTKAIWTNSSDEIIQYALESATTILQSRQNWQKIVDVHNRFMNQRPDHQMAMISATWVAKAMQRLGKPEEGAKLLSATLAQTIDDPAREQVEVLIDEIVRNLVPRRRNKDFDPKATETTLVDLLTQAAQGKENSTTHARIYYGKAQMYYQLRDTAQSDFNLKLIATDEAIPASALSPILLSVCGDILVKLGNLDRAEQMFQRLTDRYKDSVFSDAGPVGLGEIALARKEPEKAFEIFDNALTNNPGTSRFKEANIGKLKALRDLKRFDDAERFALNIAGDKTFRGPAIAQAYLILGDVLRLKASTLSPDAAAESLRKAHGYYQRVYAAYQRETELCAEAYFKAYEVLKEIGNAQLATETIKQLKEHPRLQQTAYGKKAQTL